MTKPDHRAIIAKDHTIIDKMAKFKLQELRLIAFCLAHYDSSKPDNRVFKTTVDELTAIFPSMDEKSSYNVIRTAMLGINKKPLEFQVGGKLYFWNWFSGFTYTIGSGEFEFRITPELQPYLLELEGTFTRYRLQDVYQFKSATTWKLYEHLKKMWEFKNTWSVGLDDLKNKLGISGKYEDWQNFKVTVIEPAKKDINKYSDITFTYEKDKHVRKVVGIVFFVDTKQPEDVITIENSKHVIYRMLLDYGVKEKTATTYADKIESFGKSNHMAQLIPNIKDRWQKNHKKNNVPLQKYLFGAINDEIHQQRLFPDVIEKKPKTGHTEALTCWTSKHQQKEKCPVRERGVPGQRGKCKICFEKIPIEDFGI